MTKDTGAPLYLRILWALLPPARPWLFKCHARRLFREIQEWHGYRSQAWLESTNEITRLEAQLDAAIEAQLDAVIDAQKGREN